VRLHSQLARLLGGALALVVGLTLTAPPVLAAEAATVVPVSGPIAAAAIAKVEAMPPATQAAKATPAPAAATAPGSKGFFSGPKGVVAIVLMAGALGYMGYSMNNDRVKSPAR
jgi:hypothetical protein